MNAECLTPAALAILAGSHEQSVDQKLAKLARMCGVDATLAVAQNDGRLSDLLESLGDATCLAANVRALSMLQPISEDDVGRMVSAFRAVLFYGFDDSPGSKVLLSRLSAGAIKGAIPIEGGQPTVSFAAELPEESRPLCGLRFRLDEPGARGVAFVGSGDNALASRENLPLMARYQSGESRVFLIADDAIVDVDARVSAPGAAGETYLRFAPWVISLRSMFGETCWHNPFPRAAWMIDDPLLRRRYGLLRYSDLVRAMDADRFATTIAFIPWNRNRNDAQTVGLFRSRTDLLSLCVHGCDHTGGEFAQGGEDALRTKARLALARMEEMRNRSGIGYDRVMIFPQGGFCSAAMRALEAEGYLAAANTWVFAADGEGLALRDYFDVAVTRYGTCPLFSRRYPVDLFPLAFDLFMGKPALIVEHHDYFKRGCDPMVSFTRALNAQQPGLEWSSLGEAVRSAALYRKVGIRRYLVRFYANHFALRNSTSGRLSYELIRAGRLPRGTMLLGNGVPLDTVETESSLQAEVVLEAGESAEISVRVPHEETPNDARFSLRYRTKVAARRYLSEFRDNYIARNQWLLAQSKNLKARLTPRQ